MSRARTFTEIDRLVLHRATLQGIRGTAWHAAEDWKSTDDPIELARRIDALFQGREAISENDRELLAYRRGLV